jgi:uncharacterized protein YfaS (alpha-2-macroglobulin family)
MGANRRTLYYGGGASGNIEATAMATMALIEGHRNPGTIRSALSWLLTQKDARGTWHSTQATVLALKALLAGTDRPLGDARPRQVAIAVDGKPVHSLTIAADQGEVMQQVDLSRWITPGSRRITVAEPSGTGSGYQATFVYYMPGQKPAAGHDALSIQLDYDKTRLVVDDRVTVHATAVNRAPHVAPMVILDLPLPAGFALDTSDFDGMLADGRIAKYQTTPRGVTVYLRSLEPSVPLHLRYGLRATTPVKLTAPSARVYEYYRSDRLAETDATEFRVEADPRTK